MLILFDPQTRAYAFQNYDYLYNHLNRLERDRHAKKNLASTPSWIFTHHCAHRVNNWYAYMAENPRMDQEGGLLEIISGNLKEPLFIPVTAATNLDDLRIEWCRVYCKNHNYTLVETAKAKKM